MTREPDFRDLVDDDLPPEEEQRLRRAHELLLAAGPLPELPPELEEPSVERRRRSEGEGMFQLLPRRRIGAALALAAAIAVIAFFGGFFAGYRHEGFTAQFSIPMHGISGTTASAEIKVGKRDSNGNWPLRVEAKGLPKLTGDRYYEMWLTRGNRMWTCGSFAGGGGTIKVPMTIPYDLRRGDGWIVTVERLRAPDHGRTVLTT